MAATQENSKMILRRYAEISLKNKNDYNMWINITGNCMKPWLFCGDKVRVCPKKQYFIGDIVIKSLNGAFSAHRIVRISKETIITKGDNANILDEKITKANIIGLIIAKKDCNGIEYPIATKKSKFVKWGAYFSYLNGKIMSRQLRSISRIQKKTFMIFFNITKYISLCFFKNAFKLFMKPQQD